ncbi:MAG: hypothetical protein ABIS47_11925 [Acidimicrobiales bacterium]
MPAAEDFLPDRVEAFSLTGCDLDDATGTVRLSYALDDLAFTEVLRLPPGQATPADEALVRLLWLAAAPSYYKAATPAHVTVAGGLGAAERRLLDALLGPGLGELYFMNGLDPVGPAVEAAGRPEQPAGDLRLARRSLVPVGGGKDSCVTIEALQAAGEDPLLASVRRFPVIDAVLARAGGEAVHVGRALDPGLLALNGRGARNGHVPVTAVVSLALCLVAVRAGCDRVVMSNERSASEATRDWRGAAVNHQWSKSLAAEELLADVLGTTVGPALSWFSLLRPFSELAICRLFAERGRRFFGDFSSCNAAFRLDGARRVDGWDRRCPKCRFVALALAPWLDRHEVVAIQGGDVLDDPLQVQGLLGLVEAGQPKPFECVGEVAESRVAVRLATERAGWSGARALAAVGRQLRHDGVWPSDADVAEALSPDLDLAVLVPPTHRLVVEDLAQLLSGEPRR